MSDGLNQVGKSLGKTSNDADKAVRKKSAQYGMQESARDIFDAEVPYTMNYRVQPTNKKVTMHLAFELPPPDAGLGNCCADCYCAVCEVFPPDDEAWGEQLLLTRPYVPGSVKLFMSDFAYQDGITETDPEAGIVTINNVAFTAGRTLNICYVYQYDVNCTLNGIVDGCSPYSDYLDDFDRDSTFPAIIPFGTYYEMIGTPTLSDCSTWWNNYGASIRGGELKFTTPNVTTVYYGWYLDGEGNLVLTWNNVFNSAGQSVDTLFEEDASPYPMLYAATNINCDTEIRFQFDHIPTDLIGSAQDGFISFHLDLWDGGGSRYEWEFIVSDSAQSWSGQYKGVYFGPSQDNDYFGMSYTPKTWVADTWYIFKARTLMDGTVKWKMWAEADAEPDWVETSWDSGGPYPWTIEQIEAYNEQDWANAGDVGPGYYEMSWNEDDTSPAADDTIPAAQYKMKIDYIKMTDPTA